MKKMLMIFFLLGLLTSAHGAAHTSAKGGCGRRVVEIDPAPVASMTAG